MAATLLDRTAPGEYLDLFKDYEPVEEDAIANVVRTSRGWSAEIRVGATVEIDGERYSAERVIRIPLVKHVPVPGGVSIRKP